MITTIILSLPALLGLLIGVNTNVGAALVCVFAPLAVIWAGWSVFCYVLRTIVSICRNAGK